METTTPIVYDPLINPISVGWTLKIATNDIVWQRDKQWIMMLTYTHHSSLYFSTCHLMCGSRWFIPSLNVFLFQLAMFDYQKWNKLVSLCVSVHWICRSAWWMLITRKYAYIGILIPISIFLQPFNGHVRNDSLEVPTIYKAYFSGLQ